MYSKNVIQEDDNTEAVDRESIADLSSTRKQWESLFSVKTPPAQKPVPKKNTPVKHWEVKLPYKPVNSPAGSDVVSSAPASESQPAKMDDEGYANESAIEREIRLANEREEMLKKEQEERQELIRRQNASKNQINTAAFEPKEDNNNSKVMYHEMTEADRGSELQMRETLIQQEIEEQKEKEREIEQKETIVTPTEVSL